MLPRSVRSQGAFLLPLHQSTAITLFSQGFWIRSARTWWGEIFRSSASRCICQPAICSTNHPSILPVLLWPVSMPQLPVTIPSCATPHTSFNSCNFRSCTVHTLDVPTINVASPGSKAPIVAREVCPSNIPVATGICSGSPHLLVNSDRSIPAHSPGLRTSPRRKWQYSS